MRIQLQHRVVQVQQHLGFKGVHDHVGIGRPVVVRGVVADGQQPVALDTAAARVVAHQHDFAGHVLAADPDLEARQEPARLVGNVEVAERGKGCGQRYGGNGPGPRYVVLHKCLPEAVGRGVDVHGAADLADAGEVARGEEGEDGVDELAGERECVQGFGGGGRKRCCAGLYFDEREETLAKHKEKTWERGTKYHETFNLPGSGSWPVSRDAMMGRGGGEVEKSGRTGGGRKRGRGTIELRVD